MSLWFSNKKLIALWLETFQSPSILQQTIDDGYISRFWWSRLWCMFPQQILRSFSSHEVFHSISPVFILSFTGSNIPRIWWSLWYQSHIVLSNHDILFLSVSSLVTWWRHDCRFRFSICWQWHSLQTILSLNQKGTQVYLITTSTSC